MIKVKKAFSTVLIVLFTLVTVLNYAPAQAAGKAIVVPQVQFANAPVTEYKVGDRIGFNIFSPNYGGRVEYRVVLWNDSKKSYSDLWNSSNGYPTRYYTKWQPYGNNIFTLGWIINEPGSYRITVYAKRVGIPGSKGALKGMNCDSYKESVAFRVKSNETAVDSVLPLSDVTVMQGAVPTLPLKVKVAMSDGLIKELNVTWPSVNTSIPGTQTIQGTVEGITNKASIKIIVTGQTAINVDSVVSGGNYLVNVTLKDAVNAAPEASKFSIKSYNTNTVVPIQSVTLSTDKKTISLTTGFMTTNNWYTLSVGSNNYNFIANQGTVNGISLAAQNKEVAVGGTVYASVAKYPSDVTLTYYSSNTTIAMIDQTTGLITGRSPGMATITVYGYKYGYSQVTTSFTVTVGGQSGVYVYAANMEIGVGTQQMPNITKNPSDLTLYFTSNNPSIASVNYYTGLVTGVAQGTATITIAASKNGYNTFYSSFTVTVGAQGMTLTATPTWLYESFANDGSLRSGVIDLIITGYTFKNLGYYYYYENYISINDIPYGMNYTAEYISSNMLRVTLTGKAYANKNINDQTIKIVVSKDIVNGASYNLASNDIFLDFSDLPIPDAPTSPIVDDTNDTFGWTNVSGFTNIEDYQYRVKNGTTWSSWTQCTANPQPVGNNSYAKGGVEVRVKAATGREPGFALASNAAFNAVTNIPDAPTNPIMDDINNTFGWTNVPGFSNVSDYQFSVDNGETWSTCTGNPQQLSNEDYTLGYVQVRVKAQESPVRPAGKVLKSTRAYTKDTQPDNEAPVLGDMKITFKDLGEKSYEFQNGKASIIIPVGTELKTMTIQVDDANLDVSDVVIYQLNDQGNIDKEWGTLKYNTNNHLWELLISNPTQYIFNTEKKIRLSMFFHDINGLYTTAEINMDVYKPTVVTNRTKDEIRQERNGTGGSNLVFTFANQRLNITGTNVPWYEKGANNKPPYAGNWVGVEIDRPASAADATYFYFNGVRYEYDYDHGFWYYFTLDKSPVTLQIKWGEKYTETLIIQCTATPAPRQ